MSINNITVAAKEQVQEILKRNKKEIFMDTEIYFLEKDDFSKILDIYDNIRISFNQSKRKRKPNDCFYRVAKLLGDIDNPIIAYNLAKKRKYVNITDQQKVKENIEVKALVEINVIKKAFKDLKENNKDKLDNAFLNKLEIEENEKISNVISTKEFLLENFENLEIKISTFKKETIYPAIKLIDSKQKDITEHLRIEVPNILCVHPNIFKLDSDLRKDAKHIKFILNAKKAFGDVYYKSL